MNLNQLIEVIRQTNDQTQRFGIQQVNTSLTIRNWVIGFHIMEYEQGGEDRATYGANVLIQLAKALKSIGLKGLDDRSLRACRGFYLAYPQIWGTVSAKFQTIENMDNTIRGTVSAISKRLSVRSNTEMPTFDSESNPSFPPDILLSRLSFSHFIELLQAETSLKRAFYEVQCIKNNWSVRELGRAMSTLLYERTGLSANKASVIAKAKDEVPANPAEIIKNPYLLEFLGLGEKPEYSETDLEQAIITHLQKFLIEMGRGFCFEARQKRITFDNTHYYIDLVFYHRILKCHLLVDLKVGRFDHADAGQMNLYLNYFKENEMAPGDNPPIGIILCAQKNETLVKYATGGLSQKLFVGKYLLQLPSEEELRKLIEAEASNLLEKDNV